MLKSPAYSPTNLQKRIDTFPPILIGKHPTKNSFLASYGQQYVMLAAPPGSSKGVSGAIPNLLSYPDSIVINDPKFEAWDATSGFRAAAGQKVFRFSPELMQTHRWNPLTAVSRDPLFRLGAIRSLANVLYVSENPKNQEWYNKAANVFTAIILYLMETPELPCTLPQSYEIGSLGVGIGAWAEGVIEERADSDRPLSAECYRELRSVAEASKAKSGWSTTVDVLLGVLTFYGEKTIAWALSGDDIDFSKMREEKTSVYFCVTEAGLKKCGPLMNLFFSQAIRQNSTVLPAKGGHCADGSLRLKYQVLFLMDEVAVMGRIEVMETAPALNRAYGLRFFIIFQNRDQMLADRTYGKETGNAIMKTFAIEIVFAPGDYETAKHYSDFLGDTTLRTKKISVGRGKQGASTNTNIESERRPLMLPQEINELPYEEELILIQGTKVNKPLKVRARKIFYYEEPVFKARADMTPPDVPEGDLIKVNSLTVPVALPKPKTVAVIAPHLQAMLAEQQRRTAAAEGKDAR